MTLETSKDVLFIVIAFCVLWLTVFTSWLVYYAIMIIRDASFLIREVRNAVEKVEGFAQTMHDKFERSAASFTLIGAAIKELAMWAMKERGKKARRRASDEE